MAPAPLGCLPANRVCSYRQPATLLTSTLHPTPWLAAALVGLDTVLSLGGRLVLELFTREAMATLFRRFFEHVIGQVGGPASPAVVVAGYAWWWVKG